MANPSSNDKLDSHGYAGGALELAPVHPRAFDSMQNRFPDAITEHRAINQSHWQDAPCEHDRFALKNEGERGKNQVHRQERDDKWHHGIPRAEWQRGEQKQIHHRRDGHENDLEKPDTW